MKNGKNIIFLDLIAALLAAGGLIYALLFAGAFSRVTGKDFFWNIIIVSIYILSTGIALELFSGKHGEKKYSGFPFSSGLIMAVAGGLSAVFLKLFFMIRNNFFTYDSLAAGTVLFFLFSFLFLFLIGFLNGRIIARLKKTRLLASAGEKNDKYFLLSCYFGILLGTLAFSILLSKNFGYIAIGLMAGIANIIAIIGADLIIARKSKVNIAKFALAVIAGVSFFYALKDSGGLEQYFLRKEYFYSESSRDLKTFFSAMKNFPDIKVAGSHNDSIEMVKYNDAGISNLLDQTYLNGAPDKIDFKGGYNFFRNGEFRFSSSDEKIFNDFLVNFPVAFSGKVPRHILIIGGSEGIIERELLKYNGVEKIVHIFSSAEILEAARENEILRALNKDALENPKVRVIIGEEFNALEDLGEGFDAVFLDLPSPLGVSEERLYSREFFSFLRKRISPGGFLAMNAPGKNFSETYSAYNLEYEKRFLDYYRDTLASAGFRNVYSYETGMETYNGRAIKLLEDLIEKEIVVEGKDSVKISNKVEAVENLAGEHKNSAKRQYLFASENFAPQSKIYNNFGVKHDYLNEDRFTLAVSKNMVQGNQIDPGKVNSIFRQTLPDLPIWFAKIPINR